MIEMIGDLRSSEALTELLAEANQSPFIGDLRLDELEALRLGNTIRYIYVDGQLAGFGAWMPINADWVEIGPFFVSERFQGRGIGKGIIQLIVEACRKSHFNQYAVTRNAAVKSILTRSGFEKVALMSLPMGVNLHLLSKLSLHKTIRFLRKPHSETIAHFVLLATSGS